MEDIIRPTRVAGLWLAPAGCTDPDAIQGLAQDGLRAPFQKLRDEELFDFIVIDSGPVLTDSDALLFGQYADAAIISVLRDVSRVPRVYEACERLRSVEIRLLGAVVNGVGYGKYRSYYRPYTIEVESSSV
jgi:Mrp family chromosome partitioning ATPase